MFNWHKSFSIMSSWRRGKKTAETGGEVVLTQIKKINESDPDLIESCCPNGNSFLQVHKSSDRQSDLPTKGNQSELAYEKKLSQLAVSDSISRLKRLYKFESEDSGVEMPSGANSPSTPKGSEKSFVMHSRDSSCDSGVLSASSSPTVGHLEIKPRVLKEESHTFLSGIEHSEDYINNVKQNGEDPETTMEDFIECQEEEEDLDLPSSNNQNKSTEDVSSAKLSSAMGDDNKSMNDFYKDTFDGIDDMHMNNQLKRYPTSDSLDEYMDECCRLSEVNQGASKALGSGLGYLEHICQLIEKIGQLQEHNLKLQRQVFALQKEDRMKQMKEEYVVQHCCCGAANVFLNSHQEMKKQVPLRRNRPHSMFVQSGNNSDLFMIPETGVNSEKFGYKATAQMNERRSPSLLGFRKSTNKVKFDERDFQKLWDKTYYDALPEQDTKKFDHPFGIVRELLKKTKNRNKLGMSASLKSSCPQLYRPDLVHGDLKRKERNSMIVLGQNTKRESMWSSNFLLSRKDDDI
ncbi:uncharacterized protein LOC100496010 isoform X2 [Xenopus tropicalis]|uniref:Uncharacterized protein LOC100496010 isoform X2 n=1 Tax=Xenopus tropicalis TaxID=8364 RepID=A0A8J0SR76_XENTR|nr:uncharacterized protein LOC100496010 isoform X2 [Xenopus tropicalis]|eukprot:XP_012822241.1 PREDICTED: uncharacterized protein LOC100496010 isoform X2 [Xenopus tropicalis]